MLLKLPLFVPVYYVCVFLSVYLSRDIIMTSVRVAPAAAVFSLVYADIIYACLYDDRLRQLLYTCLPGVLSPSVTCIVCELSITRVCVPAVADV